MTLIHKRKKFIEKTKLFVLLAMEYFEYKTQAKSSVMYDGGNSQHFVLLTPRKSTSRPH
jgi:hypothetical protein